MFKQLSLPRRIPSSLIVLTLGLAFSGPGQAAPPQLAATTCAACHGVDGNSTDAQYPKLAGQKESYLRLQLRAMRSGERPSPVMKAFVQSLTDAQIGELARYYSSERTAPQKGPIKADARRGAAIFRSGGGVTTACAVCHTSGGGRGMMGGGMMGSGMMRTSPEITPNLFAQYAVYLAQQLNDFASGARPSTVMSPIAVHLSPDDRKSVADYLASMR